MEDGTAGDYSVSVDANSEEWESNKLTNLAHGWYEAVLCNLGTNEDDFDEADGKIALCVRGDSTFTVKSENALNAGAVAALILNNCRPEEAVDDEGVVTAGAYQVVNMSVEYETLPMGMLSSDMTVKLVAATADVSIKEAVAAVTAVCGGNTDLGLEAKKSTYVFIGTEAEFKAAGAPGAAVVEAEPAAEEPEVAEAAPVEETPAAEEPVVEEPVVAEAPAAEETVETVVETPVTEAAQTFDFGVIAAVAAIVSAAGYAVSKKR
ncbi:MAG: PA domain-containing protein [Eubacteriales bacterium]